MTQRTNRIVVATLVAACSMFSPVVRAADSSPALGAMAAAPVVERPTLPAALEPGRVYPLNVEQASRSVRVTVLNASVTDAYGDLKAPEGTKLLVLATQWENTIPWTTVRDQKLPTEYQVPALGDHLYLVANDARLIRVLPTDVTPPGHIPVKDFKIAKIGDRVTGNVVFALPKDLAVQSLELRFYDYAHGHAVFSLMPSEKALVDVKPVVPAQKNEVVEVGVYDVQKVKELNGQAAPAGMQYVVLDVRARSQFMLDGDATAFDPKAKPGQKMKVGTVADWKDSRRYLQLVVDGEYGYGPLAQGTDIADVPRFLPDTMTGGRVAFLAPEQTQSIDLRCGFPNAKVPGSGTPLRPRDLLIGLEGKRPTAMHREAIVAVDDAPFRLQVVGQQAANEFAGVKPAAGNKFIVLDVTVVNIGREGEFFQTDKQLKHTGEDGKTNEIDPATFRGVRAPGELVWIPSGQQRTFQVVFQAPAGETRPRLAYGGVTLAKTLELKPLEGTNATAQTVATATATPPKQPPMKGSDAAKGKDAAKGPERVTAKQNLQPKGLEGVGLTGKQVNAAIDRAADGLWKTIQEERQGKFSIPFGDRREHGLSALALVHAGFHSRSPEFNTALREYLDKVKPQSLGTYQAAVLCLLIDAYSDPGYYPKLRQAARWLLEAQGQQGTWGYGAAVPSRFFDEKKAVERAVLMVDGGKPLSGAGSEEEKWKRETDASMVGQDGDQSVSQFAVLGLNAALRCGVKLPPDVWQKCLDEHRNRQNDADGGWGYNLKGGSSYGSMTCAGICTVALCRFGLGEQNVAVDPAIERGLAWLDKNFELKHNPGSRQWNYYYLYSLERAGRLLDTEFIGNHEWYPHGAKFLLDNQKPEGTWQGEGEEVDVKLPTSFALLFLTRATATLGPKEPAHGPGTLKTAVATTPHKFYFILDASGSMLEQMDGRLKFDIARESVLSLVQSLPPGAEVALRVYGHRKSAIEPGCDEDTELKVPMGKLDPAKFAATLKSLRPRGKTPMAISLEQAKGEVGRGTADHPITVVLLTDGGEDTRAPRRDPVKAAGEFAKVEGVNFHIVGFDINQQEWSDQLGAMAAAGHGKYWPSSKAADLTRSLHYAVLGIPEQFKVLDPSGKEVASGAFGETKPLPEGKYHFVAAFAGRQFERDVWINPNGTTTVTFDATQAATAQSTPVTSTPPAPESPAVPKAKFCTHCGAPVKAESKFCTSCGEKIGG